MAPLQGLAKGQIEAMAAQAGMTARREGCNAVEGKARQTAPHDDVAVDQAEPLLRVLAGQAAKQECRRQPEGDRHDRGGEIALVLVLVQGKLAAGIVAIDQAGVRGKPVMSRASALMGSPWLGRTCSSTL